MTETFVFFTLYDEADSRRIL